MLLDLEAKRARIREYNKRYNEKHPERRAQSVRAYNQSDAGRQRHRAWVENNGAQYLAAKDAWRKKNPNKVLANTKEYREANPGWMASQCAKRRTRKLCATPSWVGLDEQWLIDEAYKLAALRSALFGFKWHVDHIVPLQGKSVCGLHVVENLQVIPWVDNVRKHNKWQE